MHKARWFRRKSFELPVKEEIPEGYIMKCQNHGFLKKKEATTSGKYPRCKKCQKISTNKNHKKYPEKRLLNAKKMNLKSKFGLSLDDLDKLIKKYENLCAICRKPETTYDAKTKIIKRLTIDHCHKTNEIRGLLCNKCNFGIGYFNDSIEILKSAIQYLEKNG